MLSLAHLSDIHLAPLPPVVWHTLMSKRITGYVNWQRKRRHLHQPEILAGLVAHIKDRMPDHIAITGDLANLGLDLEFKAVRNWLHLLGEPEDVTVICGNHDAYVPGSLRRALEYWQGYATGDGDGTVSSAADYPIVRRRGAVSIIGCNSARASLPFMAVGKFGRAQGNRLAALLEQEGEAGQFRLVAIHHPPFRHAATSYKRLMGGSLFRKAVARAGAELVLHGHTHVDSFTHIGGNEKSVPVVGVPSAGQAVGGRRPAGRYNLFEIEGRPGAWKVGWQEFGYDGSRPEIVKLAEREL